MMRAMPPQSGSSLPAIVPGYKTSHVVLGIALVLVGRSVHAESLTDILAAVASAARFETPTRADVRVTCEPGCETRQVVLIGRGDALYVEVKGGQRALVRPGDVQVVAEGHTAAAALDARLGDTGILLRDLAVFTPASLALPQMSDDGPTGVVVTSGPAGRSPYVLLVHTIDPERRVIVKTQYYTESIGHLAKIRRDGAFTQIARHWHP